MAVLYSLRVKARAKQTFALYLLSIFYLYI